MYEGLREAIEEAFGDPMVITAGSAMIYQEEGGFSYAAIMRDGEYNTKGNEFIKLIIANDESYIWLPYCQEARNNQTYLSALING